MTNSISVPVATLFANFAAGLRDARIYAVRIGKRPYDAVTGRPASSTDPQSWATRADVEEALQRSRRFDGWGIFIARPLWFLDFDHVVVAGQVAPWVLDIVRRLGTYSEKSLHDGAHIIGISTDVFVAHKTASAEFYPENRFVASTGWKLDEAAPDVADCTGSLRPVLCELFGPEAVTTPTDTDLKAAWSALDVPTSTLRSRAARGGLSAVDLRLLDRTDLAGFPSQSEADFGMAMALLRAGLSPLEAFTLCESSQRGQAAILRKGRRTVPYWQRTILRAAATLGQEGTPLTPPTPRPAWLGRGRRGRC
jgi:primase-polymerase (primpol)-like protein